MKFNLTAIMMLLISALSAQELDKVTLQSGETFQGVVVAQFPGDSILLWRQQDSDTIAIQYPEIKMISKVITENKTEGETKKMDANFNLKAGVYTGTFDGSGYGLDFYLGLPNNFLLGASTRYIEESCCSGDWEQQKINMAGLRAGYDFSNSERLATPVFLNIGGIFNNTQDFILAQNHLINEYSESIKVTYENGWYLGLGLDFNYYFLKRFGLHIGIDYLVYNTWTNWYTEEGNTNVKSEKLIFNELPIMGGISLKL
ncbi:MAG: hypothetical protein MRY83_11115 [Flavobacteriales bacterium]|nr:hypothetical protein [Flavobacteriales bacterium]